MSPHSPHDGPWSEIIDDFLGRWRRGERPTVEDFVADYPELGAELQQVLPMLALMEDAKSTDAGSTPAAHGNGSLLTLGQSKVPERLGDFRLVREIGRGGMGVVYEAVQESLGRRVAVKLLRTHAGLDDKFVKRFRREARAAGHLHHTNIVPVFGVGEEQGLCYFVMQHIPGRGLDEVIADLARSREQSAATQVAGDTAQSSPRAAATTAVQTVPTAAADTEDDSQTANSLPAIGAALVPSGQTHWQSVARLGQQVAGALAYAHEHGTLHRDIKPSNLLLDAAGTVWVTDFGLAKLPDDDPLTQTGDVLGTLRYMAPEALRGTFDASSDIYSLGLTLYELCALRPARVAEHRDELIRQIAGAEPLPLRKACPAAPRDLETILQKALAHDPAQRYATAGELADDLDRFLRDRPIHARRMAPWERGWRWCRRNPAIATTVAVASVIVLATAAAAFISIRDSRDAALAALAETETQRQTAVARGQEAAAARQIAETRSQQAKASLVTARSTVREYLTLLGDDPRLKEAGLEPLRRKLLETARGFYDQLATSQDDDPQLAFDRADGDRRLGQLLFDLGDAEQALQLTERARRESERLFRAQPDVPRAVLWTNALFSHSKALGRAGHDDQAIAVAHEAIQACETASTRLPESMKLRFQVVLAYEFLGNEFHGAKRSAEGEPHHEQALAICRKLLADWPAGATASPDGTERFEVMMRLGEIATNLGVNRITRRQFDRARPVLAEAVAITRQLVKDRPDDRKAKFSLGFALGAVGGLHAHGPAPSAEELRLAEAAYREAIDIFRPLAEKRLEAVFLHQFWAQNLRNLGKLYLRQERWPEAVETLTAGEQVLRKFIERAPKAASMRADWLRVQSLLGVALLRTSQTLPAIDMLRAAEANLVLLRRDHPKIAIDAVAETAIAIHLAEGYLQQRDFAQAAQAADRALALCDAPNASAEVRELRPQALRWQTAAAGQADRLPNPPTASPP